MEMYQKQHIEREDRAMSYPNFSDEAVAQRGKELYDKQIRTQVETPENIGKIISIDIESGDYEIDDDLLTTCRRLQMRHSNPILWTERIGFNAVYAVGGTLTRTASWLTGLSLDFKPELILFSVFRGDRT